MCQRIGARSVRRSEIQQHKVKIRIAVRHRERFSAGLRFEQGELFIERSEHLAQRFADQRVVVDDQYFQVRSPLIDLSRVRMRSRLSLVGFVVYYKFTALPITRLSVERLAAGI